MNSLFLPLGIAIPVFASTNIDDIFLLIAFFSDIHFKSRQIVVGQFIGIGVLLSVSVLLSLSTRVIPSAYIGLLGLLPFAIGVKKLWEGRKESQDEVSTRPERFASSKVLSVMAVTVANGGDNISVYVPLFATQSRLSIIIMLVTFMVMTGIWCFVAHWLLQHKTIGERIGKYGHRILPWILMGLGLHILWQANTLNLLIRK